MSQKTRRIAFITGATSGIGKASVRRFAKQGYNIIATGRRTERLKDLKELVSRKYGVEIITLNFDVRKLAECNKAINSLKGEWKKIDILLNNAGLAKGFDNIHEGEIDDWEMMIDTNVKGLLYMTRLVAPIMVKNGYGHIINICSTAGHEVYPKGNVYCATKHAVDALTRSMRIDLLNDGIKVSQISPGHVEETEFAKVRFDGDMKKADIYSDFNPLRSKDVAKVIYFVATQPKHISIQDVILTGSQQANSNFIDRSGRKFEII